MTIDVNVEDLIIPNSDIIKLSEVIASRIENELNIVNGHIRVNEEVLTTLLNITAQESYNKGFYEALKAITNCLEKEDIHLQIQ